MWCLLVLPASAPANYAALNFKNGVEKKVTRKDPTTSVSAISTSLSPPLCSSSRTKSTLNFNFHSKSRRRLGGCCKCQVADLAPATSAAYGILLLGGGLFAFNKSKSKGSLFGGLTGAALMATAYFLLQTQETKAIGDALGFGSAFLFSSVFGIRLAASRKFIPAGPLLGLSVCALVVFISAYLQDSL